jgi:hypothetical protein
MNPTLHHDILRRLGEFNFKEVSGWLRQGTCPACRKKELYTNAEHPWVIRCGRINNCGWEGHVKELYPDLFEKWTERYPSTESPSAAADAYMQYARGFDPAIVKGWYTQENYYDGKIKAGTSTVRFVIGSTWWERLIDEPSRFGKQKARFKFGGTFAGEWWAPPPLDLANVRELWLVEGIFDAIALHHHGIDAVALMSCTNYPTEGLAKLREARGNGLVSLVWALDGDQAGRKHIQKFAERATAEGWHCKAAVIPQQGKEKIDWNDLHLRDQHGDGTHKPRLSDEGRKEYLYQGALLIAPSASEKALLMYEHDNRRTEFDFEFGKRLYWFKLDIDRYQKAKERLGEEGEDLTQVDIRERALTEAGGIRPIANCYPRPLYFQENRLTDESWYYFRVEFPHGGAAVKNTFSASQVSTSSEFKKRLLGIAPGAVFAGTNGMLERMMERQLYAIKRVETIDFVGYSREHGCYVLGDVAMKGGKTYEVNAEDFFDIGNLSIKSLNQSVTLQINRDLSQYTDKWVNLLWTCFGAKGLVALTYWLGSLYAEQIRAEQKSYPFLELVGEAGAGKSTLIEFLWKLFGRRDYEGFDPSKSSLPARARNFAQVSGLPVVLIESDRERLSDDKSHVKSFDWDELKTAFNGRSVRARGMATSGNETYEPPFRGAIVISQNNEVSASEAILQRIVHLTFDKSGQTPATWEAAIALESTPVEEVSGFIVRAAAAAEDAMKLILERTPAHEQAMQQLPEVKSTRIAKNHAQLLAVADVLRTLVKLSEEQTKALQAQIFTMAKERQAAISSDHPLVAEFWDSFEYLNGADPIVPMLDHSHNPDLIAVNLNHFIEVAGEARQQVPALRDLKKVLKTSRRYKFDGIAKVNSCIRARTNGQNTASNTVSCWVFRKR